MKRYESYIFDLYGTLIDILTDETSPAFWRRIAGLYGCRGAKYGPRTMRESYRALCRGDWRGFSVALNSYWMNKKALDPGSTNPQVESIIARITPWTDAVSLAGAGGGGFLFAVAKSKAAKAKIEAVLAAAGNGGRCYRFDVDS